MTRVVILTVVVLAMLVGWSNMRYYLVKTGMGGEGGTDYTNNDDDYDVGDGEYYYYHNKL